ncbi:hypothetical protein [Infirmifilum sp. NZ]|uniref:hypothetical protein n=1 Tax=Infirmifilum sp. NZ TaxID=2926850 RepID=UPI0027A8F6E4|nr:hypothetical protein [Infirmifilum sp. NZ]UNQ73419.1 hypothetical protein MOV14_00045 [Infirmifilum sp. NZ]
MSSIEARVAELERKLAILAKAVGIMIMECEELSEDEVKEIKSRLNDFLKGQKGAFMDLDEII